MKYHYQILTQLHNKFSFLKGEVAYLIAFKYNTIYNQNMQTTPYS